MATADPEEKAPLEDDPEKALTNEDSKIHDTEQRIREVECEEYVPCFWRFITIFTKVWALLTLVVLWSLTVEMLTHTEDFGFTPWYLLTIAIIMTLLESIFLINKCICCNDEGQCICTCWRLFVWVDNWRKTLIYFLLGAICFLSIDFTRSIVAGIVVLVLGILYFLRSFKDMKCVRRERYKVRKEYTTSVKSKLVDQEVQTTGDFRQASYNATENADKPILEKAKEESKNPFDGDED